MTIEQRLYQLEKRNKRLTIALTMTVVAMCAVATTGEKYSEFDIVKALHIFVTSDACDIVVGLGANDGGDGLVWTRSAEGKELVRLTATVGDEGPVMTYQPNGKELVKLTSTVKGANKPATAVLQTFSINQLLI